MQSIWRNINRALALKMPGAASVVGQQSRARGGAVWFLFNWKMLKRLFALRGENQNECRKRAISKKNDKVL